MKGDGQLRTKTRTGNTLGKGVGIGLIVSILIAVVMAMVLAWLVSADRIGENGILFVSPVIVFLAVLVGCVLAGKIQKEKIGVVICVTGVAYLILQICTGILFFENGFHNIGIHTLAVGFACVIACAICIRGKGIAGKRKRSHRHLHQRPSAG